MSRQQVLIRNRTAQIFLLSYILVMLLPLCIGLFYYYPTTQRIMIEAAAERSSSAMNQLSGLMDTQLSNVLNMPSYISGNRQIIEYDILNDPLGVKTAKDRLAEMIRTNTFIEDLFLYMRENKYLIGARAGAFYYQEISENPTLYQMSFGDVSVDELQALLDTANKQIVMPSNSVVISGKRYGRMLLFIMPVPQSRLAYGSVLVCVPVSNLASITPLDKSEQAGNVLFYSDTGALLHSSRALSDDARQSVETMLSTEDAAKGTRYIIIDGVRHLVTWSTSAKYGWRYVNLLPTSVVTREVSHFQWMTILITFCIVLLSAVVIYIAMKVNYLPIRNLARIASEVGAEEPKRSMSDFDSIQSLIESLRTKNLTLGERIGQAEPQLQRFLIAQILHGEAKDLSAILHQAEQIGIDLSQQPYRVAIADYESEQLAEDALVNLNEGGHGDNCELIAANGDEPGQLNLILAGDWSDWQLFMGSLPECKRLAFGEAVTEPTRIQESFQQASAVIDYMRLNGIDGRAVQYNELPDRVFAPRSYPLDVMQSLELAIQHGDGERMLRLMEQLCSLLMIEGSPPYFMRSVYFNAINLLITGLNRMTGGENDTVMEIGTRSMLNHYTAREMVGILRNTAQQLARMMSQLARKEASISDIMLSIERQIGSPELSLQSIADEAQISAPAFSRMFKEKTGRNFKEHVDGLRIARAKQMLQETNLPVDQIALEVGYETPTSFYRLFKKHVGLAPGEYRQAHLKTI